MSRLFGRSRSSSGLAPQHTQHEAYLSLLDRDDDAAHDGSPEAAADGVTAAVDQVAAAPPPPTLAPLWLQPRRRGKSSSWPYEANAAMASRPWLGAAEGRPSWTGERPPTRKLVKDPGSAGRPSFSLELSDSDGEKDKGIVRRQITRLKGLYYRRAEKTGA
ncbi:hypothetical protein B0H67DRAFT_638523 [Lasiosphaeris hirsuta]|uniref:Uncharacterized protein n=1 Tax=Lasiosphaeris hirsuta TaxID=260670 RepID=A0AA40E7M8_9PEZI|nr:hypothetical protein B0H67DRAFT_638523 [Lasiosphaeris hirsuta]